MLGFAREAYRVDFQAEQNAAKSPGRHCGITRFKSLLPARHLSKTFGCGGHMTEQRCDMCGKPAELTALGAMLCPTCQSRHTVYRCIRCGQRVILCAPDHPELVSRVCWTCRMQERADALMAGDVEAIRAAARGGVIPAIKLARERLGWSLNEAAWLVQMLGGDAEQNAAK
jgi:DNA-directed RNA polymerase subunit RPC12/RpoP